jgi:sulfonate transport system substrate-binding protein
MSLTQDLRRLARLGWAVLAVSLGAANLASADTLTLHIGYQKGTPLTLLKAQGSLDQALAREGVRIEWTEFPAGPPLLEAMNAGAIDLGYTGAPPPIFAQAAGSRLRYLAAEPAGPHNEAVIVRQDAPFKTISDLRGRTVAVARGSSSEYLLVEALSKAGLTLADIKPVFLLPADARAAFETGKVDAWVIWDPYLAVVQQTLATRVLADYADGIEQPYGYFLGEPDFVRDHRAVLEQVFAAVARNDAWVAQHADETGRLIAQETGVPRPIVDAFLARSRFGLLPLTSAILASQQHVADVFYKAGVIPRALDVKAIAAPIDIPH